MFAHGFTVGVNRPGGTDAYGNPLPGTSHTIDGCAGSPSGTTEVVNGAATVTTEDKIYVPYGADVKAQDEITIPAGTPLPEGVYHVNGRPSSWFNPFTGHRFGVVVSLTRAEG